MILPSSSSGILLRRNVCLLGRRHNVASQRRSLVLHGDMRRGSLGRLQPGVTSTAARALWTGWPAPQNTDSGRYYYWNTGMTGRAAVASAVTMLLGTLFLSNDDGRFKSIANQTKSNHRNCAHQTFSNRRSHNF